jgi:hypothetical protein
LGNVAFPAQPVSRKSASLEEKIGDYFITEIKRKPFSQIIDWSA